MSTEVVCIEPEKHLATIEQAARWLAEVKKLEDVLRFRDQVSAIEHYRKVSGRAIEACNEAAEIKVRAERRIGELLREMPKQQPGDYKRLHCATVQPSLADLGIEKTQSHRWQSLAAIPEAAFEAHIQETKEAGREITTAGLQKVAKVMKKQEKRETIRQSAAESVTTLDGLISQGRKFGTVYADPPWVYSNQSTRGATSDHYVGMTVGEIAAMPIRELVEENAHLHLWTTNAFLRDSFDIIEAWGFEYRSCFVWCKPQMGMGNYWRVSHEYLLFAIRGSCPFGENNIKSWGIFDRGEHSAKPEQVRLMVEKVSPGDYLELFGRMAVPGWTVFGNQVQHDLFTAHNKEEGQQ